MKPALWNCYFLFIFFMIFSCNDNSGNSKPYTLDSIRSSTSDSNFVKLKSFFDKDSNYNQEEKPEIPVALINTFYKGEDSLREDYHNSITPVDLFENKYGYFLIIEIGCGAGGFCSTFDLLVFSKGRRFIGREFLGQDAGDLGFSEDFIYNRRSDTTLWTNSVTYDTHEEDNSKSTDGEASEEKITDSVSYEILLDTSHFGKNYWQKL